MLIPDHETKVDFLNYEAISRTVVEVLKANRTRPLTIGIHGDWGAGKSSVLKMIESGLEMDKQVAILWFNGWTFEGFDDAKTILIESTITELCRQRSTTENAKQIASRLLRRVDWLKLAKRGSALTFNILAGLPSPDQIEGVLAALKGMAQNVENINPADVRARLEEIAGFLKPADNSENLPETIHAFRKGFLELLNEAKVDQLVILIDDLDRCLPATAIETLEAIRLFLFVPKTAFVIGADEAMIEYAVRQHFPDLPVSSGPLPYARNYLEKLIQVPFRIPSLGTQETHAYVTLLLVQSLVGEDHEGFNSLLDKAKGGLMKPWIGTGLLQTDVQAVDKERSAALGATFVLAQQIAPVLAEGTKGNPRQIKRFLNALLLRHVIANARGFADLISQPILAKLMLAERFQPDFYEHIAGQAMASSNGLTADIIALEGSEKTHWADKKHKAAGAKRETGKEDSQESDVARWLERDWLKRWLTLEPAIGSVDLRPYVFVARDKRLLAGADGSERLGVLATKLCGSRLEIRAAEPEVRLLSPGDADIVFGTLRERVLRSGDFAKLPPGIDGLSIVVKHHPRFQGEVVKLLGSLDLKELGLWVVKGWNESITDTKALQELRTVMQGWANQEENKFLKPRSICGHRHFAGSNKLMGTSGPSSGSGSNSPLVPSWIDEPDTRPLPGGDEPGTPDDSANDQDQSARDQDDNRRPPIPPTAPPKRFQGGRSNFSRFAGSGGSDGRALRRAARDYVRNGTGGRGNAIRRMGPSRTAVGNALGVLRGFQRAGVQETLRRLNLESLSGRGVQQVFIGLTEVVCRDGGPVDEAIARDAWLETIATLDEFGIDDLETLSTEHVQEVFLSFIAHTIEARLYQEIGVNGFEFAENLDDIERFDEQFRDYIERSVRDSFTADLAQLSDMTDQAIRDVVDKTYGDTWDLLQLLGDQEG